MNNSSLRGLIATDRDGVPYLLVDETGFPASHWIPTGKGYSYQILDVEAPEDGFEGKLILRDNLNGFTFFRPASEFNLFFKKV